MTLSHDPLDWLEVYVMVGIAVLLILWWWTERKTIKIKRGQRW